MHFKFPKKRDFWTWEELSCLAKTLGFQRDLFERNVPKEKSKRFRDGLRSQDIGDMIESKTFSPDLHCTFNMHDATYNTKVMQRSMELLSNRFLTFRQIKDARMAFQFYEHMDNAGLVVNENIILRALKMCGRAVSPVKLMQHIKHMDRLVPDRLMLYEFLDVILVCEKVSVSKSKIAATSEEISAMKNDQSLYELKDFRDMLLTEDEKISENLNETYQKSLQKLPMRKSKGNRDTKEEKPWLVPPAVDHATRERMSKLNKQQKMFLNRELDLSNKEVLTEGTFPSCSCDKPLLIPSKEPNARGTSEHASGPIRPHSTNFNLKKFDADIDVFRRERIVTEKDVAASQVAMKDVQWSIATQGERMRRKRDQTRTGQRHFRRKETPVHETEKNQNQTQPSMPYHAKGDSKLQSQRLVRARIKEMSVALKNDESLTDSRSDHGKPKSDYANPELDYWKPDFDQIERLQAGDRANDVTESNVSLDDRLARIDQLMDRVCQR